MLVWLSGILIVSFTCPLVNVNILFAYSTTTEQWTDVSLNYYNPNILLLSEPRAHNLICEVQNIFPAMNITSHLATLNLISCFIAHLLSLIISFGRPLFSLAWIAQCHLQTVLPHCCPSFTDCLLIGRAVSVLTQIPGENSKSSPCSLPWLHGLKVCMSGDVSQLDAFIRWGCCISSWIRDFRWSRRLMSSFWCSTSLINSLDNYHQGLQLTLKATAGWGWLIAPWTKVRADGCALGQLEPDRLHTQLQIQWITTIQPGGVRLISSCVQVFVWEEKLEMEGRFWKLMVPRHPSLPRGWDVSLHLPQREQLHALLISRGESIEKLVEEIKRIHFQILTLIILSKKVHKSSLLDA